MGGGQAPNRGFNDRQELSFYPHRPEVLHVFLARDLQL